MAIVSVLSCERQGKKIVSDPKILAMVFVFYTFDLIVWEYEVRVRMQ